MQESGAGHACEGEEPSLESLSRYISPLGTHHSDIDAFGASYGVIGLWADY